MSRPWSERRRGETVADAALKSELPGKGLPNRFMATGEAATFLSLSPRTLEKHRVSGTGPIYRKLGGRVVYAVADLQAWADLGLRRSTSEAVATSIPPAGDRWRGR